MFTSIEVFSVGFEAAPKIKFIWIPIYECTFIQFCDLDNFYPVFA
jgi:hypothetical protein